MGLTGGRDLARPRRARECTEEGVTASKTDRNTRCYKAHTVIKGQQRALHLCSFCSLSLRSPVLDIEALAEVCPECSS